MGREGARATAFRPGRALALGALLACGGPGPAGAGDGADETALPAAELEKRRAALEKWTFEPVALEGQWFVFHLDRRDGSFYFQDRRTGVKWFSRWGGRGFAAVLPAPLPKEDGGQGTGGWLPVDRVDKLAAEEKRLRFEGVVSGRADLPPVRFAIEVLPSERGVSLGFELPGESRGRIAAVRLLDAALWAADADEGAGLAYPRRQGEWLPAAGAGAHRARLEGFPALGLGPEPFTLSMAAVMKAGSGVLVRWLDPAAAVEAAREPVAGDSFPGRQAVSVSVESRASAAAVELAALGREEIGVVEAARVYRELLAGESGVEGLRFKTGAKPELRSLLGAAVFRPEVGERRKPGDIARHATHLKENLGIDEAAFILRGAWRPGDPGPGATGAADPAGELGACAEKVKGLGFLFGLEIEAAELEEGRRDETTAALLKAGAPQLIVVREPARPGPVSAPAEVLRARADLGRRLRDAFGLVGWGRGAEPDLPYGACFEGFLGADRRGGGPAEPWPLFTSVFGHCVRLVPAIGAELRPDDPGGFLEYLLLGEVPTYQLPPPDPTGEEAGAGGSGAADADPRWCFARNEGWAAGKGLTRHDIFLKNTYELASHLARWRFRSPLLYHRKLPGDGNAWESFYGVDLRVVVNFGPGEYEDREDDFILPPHGFFVRYPYLHAFHALRANGVDYDRPAFFVVRSLEGKMYLRAEQVRIYHGFGPAKISLGAKVFTVEREEVVKIW